MFPETLWVEENAHFPNKPNDKREEKETPCIDAGDKEERCEHHQMVPVKDSAGGAATGLHKKSEGAPDQNANQVADIENNRNEEQMRRN